MTDSNKLPAGLKLDALVAEEVMGLKDVCRCQCSDWDDDKCGSCGLTYRSEYSSDISCAREVVEKFKAPRLCRLEGGGWEIEKGWVIQAPTAALAICRAALQAVGA